jgi:hypothetical protein
MWLIAIAAIALIVGNVLRRSGVDAARANTYGSAAALAGRAKSGIGNWFNVAGAAFLVAGICWTLV